MVSVMQAIAISLSELSSVIGSLDRQRFTQLFHSPSSNTDDLDVVAVVSNNRRRPSPRLPGQAWPSFRTQSTSDAINVPR